MSVFNMIISFTTGQLSKDWIKSTVKYANGKRAMKAFQDHFSGEGNASRNPLSEADRLEDLLHYKEERAMSFKTFLTQCQKMYNILEIEGDAMSEEAKLRFLFQKIQYQDLHTAIQVLRTMLITNDSISYTQAANHLSTAVSELSEYLKKNRNISATTSSGHNSSGKSAIHNADGSIIIVHIPSWRT
uniref:Uncharacterized protein n=1 Tax=Proboscia inermis TaxID=420281 RepID=A0A7S0GE90_9STRA|mmetsp:Transcript_24723/g.25143  ORF Transcript_24723/g.25143 Transcript_24723/m.25143 type:complete len:187 (+) Transcript_24723:194-754(+)